MEGGWRAARRHRTWVVVVALLIVAAAALLVARPFDRDAAADRPPQSPREAKAEALEFRLEEAPRDAELQRKTMMAWFDAGNGRIDAVFAKANPNFEAAIPDYRNGLERWRDFLRLTGGEASTDTAERAGSVSFRLTEIGTRDLDRLEADLAVAVGAMRIAGRHSHNLFTLSHQAIFEYFNGEFDSGERIAETAKADVESDVLDAIENQFVEYRERAEVFRGQLRRARQELRRSGEELLVRPLKVFRSNAELNDDDPAR